MKTTISLLVLFALVLGGGYVYSSRSNDAVSETPATMTATTSDTQADSGAPAKTDDTKAPGASTFTMAQVATHNSKASCYAVINGSVYDLTSWISKHPGGEARILGICGKDGSKMFSGQHGSDAQAMGVLASFKIGTLAS